MKVEIVSRQNIRPSLATATPHPTRYTLCRTDQFMSPIYVTVIIFYANVENDIDNISQRLKDSLSQALTCFYPLAGRILDHRSVDCNDQGVDYSEAQVKCTLSSVLEKPSTEMLSALVPDKLCASTCNDPLLLVQANFFLSGGMALGVKLCHKIADAASLATFMKGWANTARGSLNSVLPDFNVSTRFPPLEHVPFSPSRDEKLNVKGIARRFVLEESKISELKSKMANDEVKNPTRVEAVSCFVWKRIVSISKKAAQGGPPSSMPTALLGGVNLRGSLVPPLSEYAIGNVLGQLMCLIADENEIELKGAVTQFRKSVVESRQQNGRSKNTGGAMILKADEMKLYRYSSWSRMPFYEVDFGWGKPAWFSPWDIPLNGVGLFDAWDGRGIEVWVKLVEEEMSLLEQDEELLDFASLNPNVLNK